MGLLNLMKYDRVRLGQAHFLDLVQHLIKCDYKNTIAYDFNTCELLLDPEDVLIQKLESLHIPYKIIYLSQSVKFINEE